MNWLPIVGILLGWCHALPDDVKPTPVVLWHGMGDYGNSYFTMGRWKSLVEKRIPGIYVKSLVIGSDFLSDIIHGFVGNVNQQVEEVCLQIADDPELQNGYHAIGFSQGGQFLRAVAERCPTPAMKNLISIGGQHQGVFGLPYCNPGFAICDEIRRILHMEAYVPMAQENIVQAQYWHDPLHEDQYCEQSAFLSEINNDKVMVEAYKENLKKLETFVMVKFLKDSMVVPRESSWFGFYTPGQDVEVLPLNETELYIQDKLGLMEMDEAGKLIFLSREGNHLVFSDQWFLEEIVDKYVKDFSM